MAADPDSPAERVIADFYAAFARGDADAMAELYAPDARFSDPVFGDLRGAEVGGMWRMLLGSAGDLRVSVGEITAQGDRGAATWQAWYTFSQTGRPVHNVVEAHITTADGRIVRHDDHFDLWRWSRQALGPAGLLLGWTPVLRLQLRRRARGRLEQFLAGTGEGPAPS